MSLNQNLHASNIFEKMLLLQAELKRVLSLKGINHGMFRKSRLIQIFLNASNQNKVLIRKYDFGVSQVRQTKKT